jgi:hypothetical protein
LLEIQRDRDNLRTYRGLVVDPTRIGQDLAPRIDRQRVTIGRSFGVVDTVLCGSNHKGLAFNRPGYSQAYQAIKYKHETCSIGHIDINFPHDVPRNNTCQWADPVGTVKADGMRRIWAPCSCTNSWYSSGKRMS